MACGKIPGGQLTIPGQSTSLIAQQVLYPTELLWQCTGPDDCFRYLAIVLNLMGVYGLAHVEVDA